MYKGFLLILLLWVAFSTRILSQTIVETLPGYPGPLPFKLESGYIGVGEDEAVQLFYFFVESQGNPEVDPLIIWLAGGPGCSNLHAFFFEIGPLKIQNGVYIDDVPALKMDPNSWTKVANIIYLDGPALTGYSYTTTVEAAYTSDTLSASQTTEFIRKVIVGTERLNTVSIAEADDTIIVCTVTLARFKFFIDNFFAGDYYYANPLGNSKVCYGSNLMNTQESNWDAWHSNGQVAGFKTTYARDNYSLVFATVKGGGHTVPEYKPKECFDMVKRLVRRSFDVVDIQQLAMRKNGWNIDKLSLDVLARDVIRKERKKLVKCASIDAFVVFGNDHRFTTPVRAFAISSLRLRGSVK
ncbi:peptidase S10, serine carboxypeptidase, alpha/beta hydrolase fold protein [Tanacetum coccineum]|uniref:Peptidase S10, serine carboxypeptidase, alpha/beta hydrolase fold protein n=2 Tax=Tanacetum coccineum TaxID=301880 RepID=A0ABQ5H8H1_9ASTR